MKLFGKKQYVGVRHLRSENTTPLKGALEKQLEVLRIPTDSAMRPAFGTEPGRDAHSETGKIEEQKVN